MWNEAVSTAPTEEPVSVQEFKDFVRIAHNADDEQIKRMITAARKWCEDYQHRGYVTQTRALKLDGFPPTGCPIEHLRAPLASVTSIAYLDESGASQTWTSTKYQVDTASTPPRIRHTETEYYPTTQNATYNTVTVTYVCGAAASAVSEMVKEAILRLARGMYEGCSLSESANDTVTNLLDIERTWVPT